MNFSSATSQAPYWTASKNDTEDVDQSTSWASVFLDQNTLSGVHELTSSPLLTSLNLSLDLTDSLLTVGEAIQLYNMSTTEVNGTRNYTHASDSRNGSGFPQEGIRLEHQIPLYVLIFLLSVVGNILVIVTVVQNKKMRSVTNVFLLNLSVSDLLLAVFCMPFTLVPLLLKNFIFGEFMCVAIRYLQGVSVTASCFTLVAISLERYFAICHPLKSRSWQTLSHSYKAIGLCWVCAFGLMTPLAVFHDLQRIGETHTYRCREIWPSTDGLKAYTILVNLFLLVLPIMIMCWAYGCVSYTLWIGIKMDKQTEKERQNKNGCANYDCHNGVSIYVNNKKMLMSPHDESEAPMNISTCTSGGGGGGGAGNFESNKAVKPGQRPLRRFEAHRVMRQTNTEKSRAAKKRVIKMLFIIVLEFFVFWTPVYFVYTWMVFDLPGAQRNVTPMTKSLIHLLSYISACCNPITYCFMNKNFRQSFLMAFRCVKKRYVYAHRSQMSFSCNTASTRAPATPTLATSYDKIVDSDDVSENSV